MVLGDTISTRLYLKITQKGNIVNPNKVPPESTESLIKKARKRWVYAKPDTHLTWDREISGDAFIKKMLRYYDKFDDTTNIIEIGPGYGRLLKSILNQHLAFKNYYGIDISKENIDYLKRTFAAPNLQFIHANAEDVILDTTFDIAISSLTFKHIFPTFEKTLSNISKYMNKNATVFFDLIEGNLSLFEEDETYIRYYQKSHVKEILKHSGLKLIAFDNVLHMPGHFRLLVVAQKSTNGPTEVLGKTSI
jgi:SAM-dependent methyltransferase